MANRKNFYTDIQSIVWRLIVIYPGSLLAALAVQKIYFLKFLDDRLFLLINGLPHNHVINIIIFPFDLWFPPWKILFMPMFFYFMLLPFLIYIAFFRRFEFIWVILSLFLSSFLAGLLLTLDWKFVFRQRPFFSLPTQNLSEGAKKALTNWPSFPSGHSRDTAVYAAIISNYIPNITILLWIFTIFIAFTRVYTGEHYPSDVLGGIVFGYLIGQVAVIFTRIIKNFILYVLKYGQSAE